MESAIVAKHIHVPTEDDYWSCIRYMLEGDINGALEDMVKYFIDKGQYPSKDTLYRVGC